MLQTLSRSAPTILTLALTILLAPERAPAQWQSAGVGLCGASNDQQIPAIDADGSAGAFVAWQDLRTGTADVYVQHVDASGFAQWSPDGVALCVNVSGQDPPVIIADGLGGAIVAWSDDLNGANPANVYVQKVDAAGAPQWTANGVTICAAAGHQYLPTIASDGAGGAIVAWADDRNGFADIYIQRVNSAGVPLWTANGVALCGAANHQAVPRIVADGAGGAIVTWQDGRTFDDDIYVQRVDGAGAAAWTANGVALCTASSGQQAPTIVADEAGGAIVTWVDGRSGAKGIYAQRVSAGGAPQWTSNGVALTTLGTFHLAPMIASDGASGAIVTWMDNRSVSHFNIYAARVDHLGATPWTTHGTAVCTAAGDQYFPVIAADGVGGATVTWSDFRSGSLLLLYAQRVNSLGTPQWTTDGVTITAGGADQGSPVIVPDGAEGVLVAWSDDRNGSADSDIFAQKLNGSGEIPTPVAAPVVAHAGSAGVLFPNPFRDAATLRLARTTASPLRVDVFDVSGRRLRSMTIEGAVGTTIVPLDGRDDAGRLLPSGVYFCRVADGEETFTRRMVIAR